MGNADLSNSNLAGIVNRDSIIGAIGGLFVAGVVYAQMNDAIGHNAAAISEQGESLEAANSTVRNIEDEVLTIKLKQEQISKKVDETGVAVKDMQKDLNRILILLEGQYGSGK